MFGHVILEIRIVTVAEQPGPVSSAEGPRTVADFGFEDRPRLDLVLLPAGIGTVEQLDNQRMARFLRERVPSAEVAMSVCSGSAILARAGLLDGRRATSNKWFFSFATCQGDKVTWVPRALGGGRAVRDLFRDFGWDRYGVHGDCPAVRPRASEDYR